MTTNLQLKNALPQESQYTIAVDGGLTLLVKPTGSKLWRFRYSYNGKRRLISLGKYPQTTMKEAKSKQRTLLDMLEKGIDPTTEKKIQKAKAHAEKNFKLLAIEWHAKHYQNSNARYRKLVLRRLEQHIFPQLGDIPIQKIEAPMLFNILEAIQEAGEIETGKRINSYCSMIFRYAVAKGFAARDITQDYRGMLKSAKTKHMPMLKDKDDIGELLRDMEKYEGSIVTKSALLISAYIFVRPSELANSKWEYIDFEKSQWLIPAELMKMRREHLIPFPLQVKSILQKLHPITGHSEYIFPNERRPEVSIHSETVNKALRRIKNGKYIGRMVSHGFRGMASTLLNESGNFRPDVIERQLAHVEGNKVRGAYNHAEYLEERKEMMQWYANYLNELKKAPSL